jgi:UDP-N-acetylmuramate dehydrogenase
MAGKSEIKEAIAEIAIGKILYDEPMSRYTSLCVGGNAGALVFIESEKELIEIVRRLRGKRINFIPVGNLTNIIVRDGGYKGAILVMKGLKEINCASVTEGNYIIDAQAGASLSGLISFAAVKALTGLEFCAGIPGSVGGAVWMNAGAYGNEIKDIIQTISLLTAEGEKKTLRRVEISFGYRSSGLPAEAIILNAQFKLEKGQSEQIKGKISEIIKARQQKHPLNFPNAGSIFKNLPGQPAGRLIEEMGLKGTSCNDAEISPAHANFIVNKGKATASDVLSLITTIQTKAKKEKGINLETEVVIIGED